MDGLKENPPKKREEKSQNNRGQKKTPLARSVFHMVPGAFALPVSLKSMTP